MGHKIKVKQRMFYASHFLLLFCFTSCSCSSWAYRSHPIAAFANSKTSSGSSGTVSELLSIHSSDISSLKTAASSFPSSPEDDVFYLRYCLSYDDLPEAEAALKSTLQWRNSAEGKEICEPAFSAFQLATSGSSWDNDPVRNAAPNASIINEFITPSQILTTQSRKGDLVYCICAGKIDDTSLMSRVSLDQMVAFFLYCKEIHSLVANARSLEQDKLIRVITCNDLTGVKLVGGDSSFRNALSVASNKANGLYPSLAGPTLLLNLPPLLGALVKIFTPLFPPEVRKRLKFETGILGKNVNELRDLVTDDAVRENFWKRLDDIVYKKGEW